jgi:hypothetical protein
MADHSRLSQHCFARSHGFPASFPSTQYIDSLHVVPGLSPNDKWLCLNIAGAPEFSGLSQSSPFFLEDTVTAVGLTCVTFVLVAGARPTNLTLTSMLGETRPQATRLPWLRRFVPTSALTSPKSTAIRQLSCWQTPALQRNSTSLFVLVYLVAHAPGD